VLAVSAAVRSQLLEESSNRLTKCAYLKHGPLNRALTKLQLPFPGFNLHTDWAIKIFPLLLFSNRALNIFFIMDEVTPDEDLYL
jgi:hypothetical protein